jgi:hypothetical protein
VRLAFFATLVASACWTVPARADHHLIKLREVYPGSVAQPTAQYVMLQMYALGQTMVGTHASTVTIYDEAGANPQVFTFVSNVSNGASQSTILVGTAAVLTAFGVTPDLTMSSAVISPAGGKACFDAIPEDCVAWGAYTGATTGVGSPVAPTGIPDGMAIRRRIDNPAHNPPGDPSLLDTNDDTDDSATDFAVVAPNPIPNSTPVSSTTTTIHGGSSSTTTTTTIGSTPTTTTLPCPAGGVDGALCLLGDLPPMVCRPNPLPRKVRITLQAATNVLRRSQSATGGHRNRLIRKGDRKLVAAGTALDRAVAKGGKITDQCATALRPFIDAARSRLAQVLPPS